VADKLVLTAGDQILKAPLQSTDAWKKYRTFTVGDLHLARPGVVTITVQSDGTKSSFCNLRGVTLTPVK